MIRRIRASYTNQPELIKFYNNLSSSKNFEIVFASSDRDDSSFTDYFKDMPWTALPFSQRETKALLSSKYGVKGIPTLVWLDEQGELITKNGREKVSMDMSGASFPWRPKSLAELTTGPLVGQGGAATTFESLKDKVVFIYFSAHWCPPCKGFTPKLVGKAILLLPLLKYIFLLMLQLVLFAIHCTVHRFTSPLLFILAVLCVVGRLLQSHESQRQEL